MLRVKANYIVYLIVVCFALLQVFSPFIHAHLDADQPIHNTGFHVGTAHEEMTIDLDHLSLADAHTQHSHADFLSATPHAAHTISVASGIPQDLDSAFIVSTSLLVLFFLCLACYKPVLTRFFTLNLTPHQLLKRRLPAPRAPPQI